MSDVIQLLAQANDGLSRSLQRWGDSIRRGSMDPTPIILVGVLLVAGLFVLRYLTGRKRGRACIEDHPADLFRRLVDRHRLDRGEARALSDVAAANQLADPAVLFARPGLFDRCFEDYVRGIRDDDLRARADGEIARLRTRLFGALGAGEESAGETR